MDLTKYRNKLIGNEDERAVSPVIGVILMVAITVILAAVIAAFVLDIGDLDDSAPNAQFDWEDQGSNNVTVTHTSGDDIDVEMIRLGDAGTANGNRAINISDDSGTWSAGETAEIENLTSGEDTVQIVWEDDGSATIIAEYDY